MDLRGIHEIRPGGVAEAVAAAGGGGPCVHACSHADAGGGLALVSRLRPAVRLRLVAGGGDEAGHDAAEASRRLISASLLKIRGEGHAVLRLSPDDAAAGSPGWDGSGWLDALTRVA